ncbi:MAG: serine/threonine protein kinase, partial [Tepidisphaeraceae bacterium]
MSKVDPYWRVKDLFAGALEKPHEQREAFLISACGGDAELRRQVDGLLALHENASALLETSNQLADSRLASGAPRERLGTVIGPYKLLQEIGEGGFGTVYMAEQEHPVRRRVALKIIKLGMDTKQVIARFEAERQALAMMDHPGIAKVFDAGVTETGRPYFVMELVKGVQVTKYCDEKHLPLRARLELFMQVCQAVQHAHQKGIIHRDLKPSNVLVAEYDNHAVPKVIDFGVAKATAHTLTDRTMFTEFGQVLGTMEYMSPEQAKLNQLDIDTRSDIYSLGVLLYELLTGTTPLEHQRVKMAALLEVLRLVREEEAPRPSTRLSTTEQLASISANRGLEPKKLSGLVRGELDWIVMKALEKDRARRYETASGFARDVENYLRDEAVEACPPSATYRFRKFARRNRAALAIALALGIAVLLAVAGLVVNNRLVTREKNQKEAALARALEEKQRADQNLARARKAVNDYLTHAANNPLLKEADFHELRRNLL